MPILVSKWVRVNTTIRKFVSACSKISYSYLGLRSAYEFGISHKNMAAVWWIAVGADRRMSELQMPFSFSQNSKSYHSSQKLWFYGSMGDSGLYLSALSVKISFIKRCCNKDNSGIANKWSRGQSTPLTAKNCQKKKKKNGTKREGGKKCRGRKGKNQKGSFTFPLLTKTAGYMLLKHITYQKLKCKKERPNQKRTLRIWLYQWNYITKHCPEQLKSRLTPPPSKYYCF